MVHYSVEKPVVLYKPIYAEISPLFNFVIAEIVMAGLSVTSYLIARFAAGGGGNYIYGATGYLLAALLAFFIPYTIWLRIIAQRSTIQVSKEGIIIKTPTLQQTYAWQQITLLYMTIVVCPKENNLHEGFFYLFFKLNYGEAPQPIFDLRKGKPYYFLSTSSDFNDFLGKSEPFDFAICLGNISEDASKRLITLLPDGATVVQKKIRPLIKVQTEREYNDIVKNSYLPETAEAYLFPTATPEV